MKHWKVDEWGNLNLNGGEGRIIELMPQSSGVGISEMCDGAFGHDYTKAEALEMVEELKQWIENEVE